MYQHKIGVAVLLATTFAVTACGSSSDSSRSVTGPITELPDPEGEETGAITARLQATYSGNMTVTAVEDGQDSAIFSGDLRLDVDTDRATQITAEADNMVATDLLEDRTFNLDGTLTGDGSVDMTDGTLGFGLTGTVNVAGSPADSAFVDLTGSGSFFGEDADQAAGTLTGEIEFDEDEIGVASGEFLVNRDAD